MFRTRAIELMSHDQEVAGSEPAAGLVFFFLFLHQSSLTRSLLEVERAQIFRARAYQNSPRAFFELELFTNKNAKIWARDYFGSFRKLGSNLRA